MRNTISRSPKGMIGEIVRRTRTLPVWVHRLELYILALLLVAIGALVRSALTYVVGPGLPTYITFYPAVMLAALIGGARVGLVATAATVLLVNYWLLAPHGEFGWARAVANVGQVIFLTMGLFMSVVAGLYRRARDHLEDLVIARTTALSRANERLREQTDELTSVNKDLEQFAYIASHDLQEPLRAVSGFVTLLQQRYGGKLDEKADSYINSAVEGASRMQALINGLLEYSRVGSRGNASAPANADDALKAALANLQTLIQESGAVITSDPLPRVRADAVQLAHVFQNLIANAIKFRSEKTPEVHVGSRRRDGSWLFWVRDNGIGIDPQYNERIFMIFQRLHTRSEYPGTGIGLAICKRIVERHGGSIWVESQPGRGSTFYFTLPDKGQTHESP